MRWSSKRLKIRSSFSPVIERLSDQPGWNDVTRDIGESEVTPLETIGQRAMIDAEAMKHGCMEVVDRDWVFDCIPTDFIGFSINLSAFDSASSKKHGVSHWVMIPAGVRISTRAVLAQRGSSKLTAPDDHGFIQHASLF